MAEIKKLAESGFGEMVKAVVDVKQEIMALGSELHVDAEAILIGEHGSAREHTWGINLYPEKSGAEFLEFNSMVNIKPAFNNRSRGITDKEIQARIKTLVDKLVVK